MEILILAVMLGLIPAAVAQSKGRSFIGWWIYGSLLLIIALPHALIMSPLAQSDAGMRRRVLVQAVESAVDDFKTCPECAEPVRLQARKCRYCGHSFAS